MAYIGVEISKAIEDNDLNKVIFKDPFSDTTRKTKRNLLIASFVCLLIAILHLEITGFLGLKAATGNLGNELAKGLACIVVIYSLVSFLFYSYIDYSAWQFEKERQLTKPYLDLISLLNNHINTTAGQVSDAADSFENMDINLERKTKADNQLAREIKTASDKLTQIDKRLKQIQEEALPLIDSWKTTIQKMDKLNWRLKARFTSFWLLDIALPLAMGIWAISQSYDGLANIVKVIAG